MAAFFNSSIIKVISLAFTIFGGLGGLILIFRWSVQRIFERQILLRKIARLAPAITIGIFTAAFGAPTFINHNSDSKQYIFTNKWFYISALTDLNDTVRLFSVTTRSFKFTPSLRIGPYSANRFLVDVKLGKTKFTELDKLGYKGVVNSGLGNRRAFYSEAYYFGNPGLYQSYAFGANDAGIRSGKGADFSVLNKGAKDSGDSRLKELREHIVINTYTIAAPFVDYNSNKESPWLGVDYDQVRVLNQ